jgi:hypothetical protein
VSEKFVTMKVWKKTHDLAKVSAAREKMSLSEYLDMLVTLEAVAIGVPLTEFAGHSIPPTTGEALQKPSTQPKG